MLQHFDLCIDGFCVINNEIKFPSPGESLNLLELYHPCRKAQTMESHLKIDCVENNAAFVFVVSYDGRIMSTKLPSVNAVQDYLNKNLQGALFSERANKIYRYIPLQITKGWRVRWNHLVAPQTNTQLLDEDCLIQDIACFEMQKGTDLYQLDIGYPEGDKNAEVYMTLVLNHDWDAPVASYSFASLRPLIQKINEIFHEMSYTN